jgi:hypothetical protein
MTCIPSLQIKFQCPLRVSVLGALLVFFLRRSAFFLLEGFACFLSWKLKRLEA